MGVRARRFRLELATLLGFKSGFFIPYRYARQVPGRADRPSYASLEPFFAEAEPTFRAMLQTMDSHSDALHMIKYGPRPEPRWNQDWFPRLDAAAAYVFVRQSKPTRVVEVGSGHSTRFLTRAVRDGGLSTEVTSIDPQPRADIDGTGAHVIRSTVQDAGTEPFDKLASGDVLFIDSSHILMPGTDVDLLFNHVLPRMPRGLMVHIHDVVLPDDYPPEWEWRAYNEQLGVAGLVQGKGYRILWSSHYVATRMADAVAASVAGQLELKGGAKETSLWLMKA